MSVSTIKDGPRGTGRATAAPAAGGQAYAGPFACDPGMGEAWWWLGIPVALGVFLVAAHAIAPAWYMAWIVPEGYGFLEVGHFLIPLAAAIVAVRLLFRPFVRAHRLIYWYLVLAALGCFYIAGEEHSWGQHFFYWDTPAYWAEINRQQETNLHNVSEWLNHKPRVLLEIGIVVGGLLVPAVACIAPRLRASRWALFLPAGALVPTALGMLAFKTVGTLEKELGIRAILHRPSETTESYIYIFLLFYLIVFARRIAELEARRAPPAG